MRADVAAILFDEPLTVIDPALKWQLRSKLKAVHRALDLLMIYVTHDQVEALTFADKVVVMKDGRVLQIGDAGRAVRAPGAHVRRLLHRLAGNEFVGCQTSSGTSRTSTATTSSWPAAYPALPDKSSAFRSECGPITPSLVPRRPASRYKSGGWQISGATDWRR